MNIHLIRLYLHKVKHCLWATVIIAITCPPVLAGTIKVSDQFGNPIKNVVVSFTVDEPTESANLAVAVMDQVNKQFAPEVLVVHRNQTVSFPNSDNIRHHLYSFSKPKPFEFKMFSGGDSKELLFDQSGIVVLGCNIHDQMVGYIYVADKEQTRITDDQGLAALPNAGLTLTLWHPLLSTNKVERVEFQMSPTQSAQPEPVTLTLLAKQVEPSSSKFISKKFGRGKE